MKNSLYTAAAALSLLVSASAHATIFGSLWVNDFSDNADVVPGGTPTATFTTNAINYDSTVGGYTIGGFLNSPTFLTGGSHAGDSLNNVHIQFTGSTFLNAGVNSFVVPHDDGLRLIMTGIGTVLDQPGPTSPVSTPFSVTAPSAGLYNFILDYNECCGAPARLGCAVNGVPVGTVPEPASWTLILVGFGVIGATMRRRSTARLSFS